MAEFHLTPADAGYLASSVFIGMLFGGVIVGTLADIVGRRRALMFAVGFYGVTSLLAGFAWDYRSLVAIRIIEGFGLGAEVPLIFTYLSEFLPMRRRALLLASSVAVWQAASFVAALAAAWVIPEFGWRGLFVFGGIPALLCVLLVARLPESVRFLLSRGRTDEAAAIARSYSTVTAPVAAGIAPVATASVRDLLRPGYVRATLSIWIMQFCGGFIFVGVAVWLPSIFVRMGFPLVRSFVFTAAIVGAGALGNVAGGLVLDRIGRKATLAIAFIIGGLLMFLWGLATSGVVIVTLGALTAFFAFGSAGGPLFTYTSEIYPTRFRGAGTGWAAGWQRMGGIVAPPALGLLLQSGAACYSFFAANAAVLLVGGIGVLVLGYETRGKSLEAITAALSQ